MKEQGKTSRRTLFGAAFYVWRFRIVTAVILTFFGQLLNNLVSAVVNLNGIAITTANLTQFLDWKSILIVFLWILTIFFYFVFEILSQIYLCEDLIEGIKPGIFRELKRGFCSLGRFMNPKGILILIFVLFGVPLIGLGFSIGLTKDFYIPRFISSVMFSNPLILVLYGLMIAFFVYFSLQSMFCFHAILIDGMKPADALKHSKQIVREHWKNLFVQFLKIFIISGIIYLLAHLFLLYLPGLGLSAWGDLVPDATDVSMDLLSGDIAGKQWEILFYRIICACALLLGAYLIYLIVVLRTVYFIIQLTRMYYMYTGRSYEIQRIKTSKDRFVIYILLFLGVPVLTCVSGVMTGFSYDYIFDPDVKPGITAHRTGGYLASENSLEGIDASVQHGCYGAETDIQRTKDGCYIILHDNTFKRMTGVNKKPGDMTLEEIKKLRIKDTTGSGALLPVPTMEELLDRGKGRIKLFLELKGVSADRKMADDMVKAIKERDMTDDVILISLNYRVINYIERTYPEFETGILIFAGIGDVSKLNCDMIIMEEEMSTDNRIAEIHKADKKAGVWTVNTKESMYHFLLSEADTIITDDIVLALNTQQQIEERSEYEVLRDALVNR